jgi:hypothetical protein
MGKAMMKRCRTLAHESRCVSIDRKARVTLRAVKNGTACCDDDQLPEGAGNTPRCEERYCVL